MHIRYLVARATVWGTRYRHPVTGDMVARSLHIKLSDLRTAQTASSLLDLLINDKLWWDLSRRSDAERIHAAAAASFYDRIEGRIMTPNYSTVAPDAPGFVAISDDDGVVTEMPWDQLVHEYQSNKRELELLRSAIPKVSADAPVTVGDAYEKWSANFRTKTARQTMDVKRRCERVISSIANTQLRDLTVDNIDAAISTATKSLSANMIYKSRQDLRRFLVATMKAWELKFLAPIVEGIRPGSLEYNACKDILDEKQLMAYLNSDADFYWKGLIAVLAASGVRLSELANLHWTDVDFNRQLLHVRPSEHKSRLKTRMSQRVIRLLDFGWSWIETILEVGPPVSALIFPRVVNGQVAPGRSWLNDRSTMVADDLSKRLIKLNHGLGPELARRARRFYSTRMQALYGPTLAALMAGHGEDVQRFNYTDLVTRIAEARPL